MTDITPEARRLLDAISTAASDCRLPCRLSLETAERSLDHARTLEPGPIRDAYLAAAGTMAQIARHLGVVLSSYDERYAKLRIELGTGDVSDLVLAQARQSGDEFLEAHEGATQILSEIESVGAPTAS